MTRRLAFCGSQIAFQINTALVSVIKPHYSALVNIIEYAHRRVSSKTTYLSAMQFAKASGAAHGALAECAVTLRLGQSAALPGSQIANLNKGF